MRNLCIYFFIKIINFFDYFKNYNYFLIENGNIKNITLNFLFLKLLLFNSFLLSYFFNLDKVLVMNHIKQIYFYNKKIKSINCKKIITKIIYHDKNFYKNLDNLRKNIFLIDKNIDLKILINLYEKINVSKNSNIIIESIPFNQDNIYNISKYHTLKDIFN